MSLAVMYLIGYIRLVIEVVQTEEFAEWLHRLQDQRVRARIAMRLRRAEHGNLGDVRPIGNGVLEMRVDYGAGYRVYFVSRGQQMIVFLCGGDNSSQDHDIERAKALAKEM
jgi:putative addiction module killer protein